MPTRQGSRILHDQVPATGQLSQTTSDPPQADILGSNLLQHEPTVIPASAAVWVAHHQPFRLVEAFRAEGIGSRDAAELVQEVVRVHVVLPCRGHGLRHFGRVEIGEDLFDAPELGDGVDFVRSERVDQLVLGILAPR